VRYEDGIVQRADIIKYLGLNLDTKLGFSGIIRHIRKKNTANNVCAEKIASFNYVFNTEMSIYYAFVFSQLSFIETLYGTWLPWR
jgi:hypothetical protein